LTIPIILAHIGDEQLMAGYRFTRMMALLNAQQNSSNLGKSIPLGPNTMS
jgi:hypothetical protein